MEINLLIFEIYFYNIIDKNKLIILFFFAKEIYQRIKLIRINNIILYVKILIKLILFIIYI